LGNRHEVDTLRVFSLSPQILSITDSRDSLKKEYDKLAAERDRIAAERDQVVEEKAALSSRLKSFDTAVETDSRLVEAKRQLEESEERSTELFVKYEEACEFNNRWKTRFEKLGLGAESTAKDAKLADVRKQLKELEAVRPLLCLLTFFFLTFFTRRAGKAHPCSGEARSLRPGPRCC
jgi:DNA repair exonuclease SbcCD ATPase subunit